MTILIFILTFLVLVLYLRYVVFICALLPMRLYIKYKHIKDTPSLFQGTVKYHDNMLIYDKRPRGKTDCRVMAITLY